VCVWGGGRLHDPPAWAKTALPLCYDRNVGSISLAFKVQIRVLSLKARRCHVSQIQERFTQNKSVERLFIIGNFRLTFGQGNDF
jgi:hypothetical protein